MHIDFNWLYTPCAHQPMNVIDHALPNTCNCMYVPFSCFICGPGYYLCLSMSLLFYFNFFSLFQEQETPFTPLLKVPSGFYLCVSYHCELVSSVPIRNATFSLIRQNGKIQKWKLQQILKFLWSGLSKIKWFSVASLVNQWLPMIHLKTHSHTYHHAELTVQRLSIQYSIYRVIRESDKFGSSQPNPVP